MLLVLVGQSLPNQPVCRWDEDPVCAFTRAFRWDSDKPTTGLEITAFVTTDDARELPYPWTSWIWEWDTSWAVSGVRLYDLRHSFGTMLYRVTKDLATVSRFLMHANVRCRNAMPRARCRTWTGPLRTWQGEPVRDS
jgi:hypothetical protein